ncbi:hypothetical protein SAMN02745753_03711 [Marinomonas polaris DSM 16579]|uniref:Uncharacterized protein n=1 Tax=Marinomonas polaris DSM 16579 TaxID=1122206 RepID=A0A1M5IYG8_9GAMM|nr:hypothetical protein [Marinomonas polaris]SHG33354.1 hypothetical protein SAMN02745753_03711 [Marinomonas polaris DSM 16579]
MKYGREVTFSIPEASILLNVLLRMNRWDRKEYHKALCWSVRAALESEGYKRLSPFKQCKIEIDRYSSALGDWDGVMGGLKPLFDTLVVCTKTNPLGLGVIEDDNPNCIIECPAIRQHKSTRKAASTVVTITEILEA